ncbi:MAG: hypothetical protein DRP01_04615 [Archaeoglobales archaeon]|nr:MAG: hypothetical protein DRP01_04615 [Archaeoglobales archaeon]
MTRERSIGKVLLSIVIAIAMVGIPANIFIAPAKADTGGPSPPTNSFYIVVPDTVECAVDTVNITFAATDADGLVNMTITIYDPDGNVYDYTTKTCGVYGGSGAAADVLTWTAGPFCPAGTWTVEFNATDTLGSWNSTTTTFTVVDTQEPWVADLQYRDFMTDTWYTYDQNTFYVGTYLLIYVDPEDLCKTNFSEYYYTGSGSYVFIDLYDTPLGDLGTYLMSPSSVAPGYYYLNIGYLDNTCVGRWNYSIIVYDGYNANVTYWNFTVLPDPNPPVVYKEYGQPCYVAEDPEFWHSQDGSRLIHWITSNTTIWINATDPEGIAYIAYRIWNFTHGWGPWNYVYSDTAAITIYDYYGREDECKHKIEYYAVDEDGNVSETYWQYFYVDDTPPSVTIEFGEPFCTDGSAICITSDTPIWLNATDGEWNIQNRSCPSGIDHIEWAEWWNGTWMNTTGTNYAILVAGGYDNTSNFASFWNDLVLMYDLLTNKFGYHPDNVYVLWADGNQPNANNMPADELANVTNPTGIPANEIDNASTKAALEAVFDELAAKMTAEDTLYIGLINHGGANIAIGKSYFYGFEPSGYPVTSSTHLAQQIMKLPAYKHIWVTVDACHSGGFISTLTVLPNVFVGTAAPLYTYGYAINISAPGSNYGTNGEWHGLFMWPFMAALNGKFFDGSPLPWDPDLNGDGLVSFYEAWNFTYWWDYYCNLTYDVPFPPPVVGWSNWTTADSAIGDEKEKWMVFNGNSLKIFKEEDCEHRILLRAVDHLGHWSDIVNITVYVDNTPPAINEINVSAPWYENGVAKNLTGGCVNITVNVTGTGCCPNATVALVQLEVDVINSSSESGITTIRVNMTNIPGTSIYYFNWCNDTIIDVEGKAHIGNTAENGLYTFRIYAYDCLGNENVSVGHFWIKPPYDVDVIELVKPDPTTFNPTPPTSVVVKVKNNGVYDAENIRVALQIYEEIEPHEETYKCWDIESCIVSGMWETYSWDGDSMTWYWSENRYNSPTHSWHSQPDNLDTYEAYSHDSLILSNNTHGIYIPETYYDSEYQMNKSVAIAYLTFYHWCRGELGGALPVDYGNVYIRWFNTTSGEWENWTKVGGPYYYNGTDDGVFDYVKIDISDYIGKWIQVNFTWFADGTHNFEGWYIDDICILLSGSMQPLVWQEYKDVPLLRQNETVEVEFPLPFTPKEEQWYFFESYAWIPNDVDGYGDKNGEYRKDPRTGFEYWDPYNGVNYSIYFGDICDAAVISIKAPAEVEMPDEGVASIPIEVTVYNNGTLTEDVPVEVTVKHKLIDTFFYDDVESGDLGYQHHAWGTDDVWTITDKNFYSPYHSWYWAHEGGGETAFVLPETIDYDSYIDKSVDITFKAKWKFESSEDYICPVMFVGNTYWFFISRSNKLYGAGGWEEISLTWMFKGYLDYYGFDNIIQLAKYYVERDGYSWPDDFHGFGIGMCSGSLDPMQGATEVYIDDITATAVYEGATVWNTTYVIEDLKPGEYDTNKLVWNSTEYCDYVISAEIKLDCDVDASNNKKSTETRIYEQIYIDGIRVAAGASTEAKWSVEDNTCGLPDDWHIVEECSICPDDHFWWNGEDDTGTYRANRFDYLMIDPAIYNETSKEWEYHTGTGFDWTGMDAVYINFSTYYLLEYDWEDDIIWDTGFLEVSNDSGMTWFVVDQYYNNSDGWKELSYKLEPGVTKLKTFYLTGFGPVGTEPIEGFEFDMPANFFTENMLVRFVFYSDEYTNWKGWYIDDVEINAYNGTAWNVMFFDDMEDIDSSYENWTHAHVCYGVHWHITSDFGNGPTDEWFYNGEERHWEVVGITPVYELTWNTSWRVGDPLPENWTFDDNAGDGTLDDWLLGYGYPYVTWFSGLLADVEDDYLNFTITLPESPVVHLNFTFGTGNYSIGPGYTVKEWWVEVTNGTAKKVYKITIPWDCPLGYICWDYDFGIDLSEWSGQTVTIAWHFNTTLAGVEALLGDIVIKGYSPGLSIPYHQYYNNVDEKLIFEFDLRDAYEAILTWDQNYSFAEGDVGYVEIWTGNEWKTLFIVKGDSGGAWAHMEIDISSYVGGDELTLIRYRFVSNETEQSYGWLIDNVSIEGKIDHTPPTIVATLDPAEPDGCNGWYRSPVTITLTATDNREVAAIYYRIDGGAWSTYKAPITIDVDGEHIIEYYAVDEVGNPSEVGSVSFKIDLTTPTVTITYPEAGYIYLFGRQLFKNPFGGTLIIGGMTFQASASDATSGVDYVHFEINGMAYDDATLPYEFWWHKFDLLPKKYTLTAVPYDEACNAGSQASLSFTHWL